MLEPTRCASYSDFLLSLSPALSALLSGIGLWVASRARTTSKAAQQTSQEALRLSQPPHVGSSVIVSDRVVQALRSASLRDAEHSWSAGAAQEPTSTLRGDGLQGAEEKRATPRRSR